jgi:hypothetical protein
MAGKVRFYRGAQGTSLPETHQDGAIFIIERAGTNNLGDMYVDMDNGKRLHIIPDSELIIYNSTMSGNTSTLGQVYIFQETNKTGIAVGDGNAYIGDLPVYNFSVKNALQNKVNAYLGTEYMSIEESKRNLDKKGTKKLSDDIIDASETLVLSREL